MDTMKSFLSSNGELVFSDFKVFKFYTYGTRYSLRNKTQQLLHLRTSAYLIILQLTDMKR